ncbi:B-type cyclin, partial [Oleoguttula sp. CCFEE 5521]
LGPLLHAILECCEDPRKHHLAVFEKYVDKRYKKASTFVETEMGKNFQLPRVVRGASLPSPIDALPNGWR